MYTIKIMYKTEGQGNNESNYIVFTTPSQIELSMIFELLNTKLSCVSNAFGEYKKSCYSIEITDNTTSTTYTLSK